MEAKIDAASVEKLANTCTACIVKGLQSVRRDVGLRIDHADIIFRRPADSVLKRQAPPKINPDALFQCLAGHLFPLIWQHGAAGISFQ
mgnify:CR=1 FL=1